MSQERFRPGPRGAAVVVFLASLPVMLVGVGWGSGLDVAIAGGDRVFHGDTAYRDFWSLYAPGSTWLVAAVFAVAGRELLAVQLAAAVLQALACTAFWGLLREAGLTARSAAMATVVLAVCVWQPAPSLDSYAVPRLLLLVGWACLLRGERDADRVALFGAGVVFGAAAWFKHDVAAYAALGSGLALGLRAVALNAGASVRFALGPLVAGCALLVLPGVMVLAVEGGADAWQQLIVFPARDFAIVRGELYPGWLPPLGGLADAAALRDPAALYRAVTQLAEWGQAIVPQLVWGIWAVAAWRRSDTRMAGGLGACCLPLFWLAAHVQQNTHLFSMGLLCCLLLADLGLAPGAGRWRVPAWTLAGLLTVSFALPSALQLARMQREFSGAQSLAFEGARGIRVSAVRHAQVAPIVSALRQRVPHDEPIYVGLGRHDAVVIGDASFYYLADRRPATRYHEMHPGVVDREPIQREMVRELEAGRVRGVVRWNFGWSDVRLDAILADRRRHWPELGSRVLDDYLDEHFEPIEVHGEYELWWRRSGH